MRRAREQAPAATESQRHGLVSLPQPHGAVLGAVLAAATAAAALPAPAAASVARSHHPDADLFALIERARTADSLCGRGMRGR
jgi:hypothetical protein